MRALVIDNAAIDRAKAVRQYAILHKEPLAELIRRMNKPEQAPGNNLNHVLELFDGWRVVLSVEQQKDPIGWCWHVSVSVHGGESKYPHPVAVEQILGILGITAKIEDRLHGDYNHGIVEIWFRYDGP